MVFIEDKEPLNIDEIAQARAIQEEDVPLDGSVAPVVSSTVRGSDKLELEKIASENKNRQYGYYLAIACLIGVGVIYIIDTIVTVVSDASLGLSATVIDLLKTVLLFVLGYLFGKNRPD